ncbi:flagellar motor switch protein FliN/FliY [Caldicellulosiruptor bescii]|uniref:CheC, inhibitor of MCP methylation / FliN fusion protein n=2 Tax=Caldicellulosiruptor bescii TaxID=31899 RepID=B9MM12_CALBD|nr:flagellar motor switch phosphatase FliY [Caldicellulosiruptor bescii]ACM61235.1 CheC, inhibitor of MCP methylation / FliN fusion protein [Caldicellulosiruptor bescii DSM 6725]PBC88952.1 flagellar motor switch protein FliN/FliY [Caldicellulosiruptor bescii]PBC91566.1 flagellar motor switch protein FliN/FliY [Caldicellulosiruptor bescii]PBD03021.1 flagellar motor switch protein FliN/FliY [Caldicellulosiruptor bescii]PBD07364.1 flagellar motor switch protein FliN/FliY [Caldicellulosiruptor bes
MSDLLSQDEIDALLRGMSETSPSSPTISDQDKDVLGEIGNISMGTAATTLSILLNQKVNITTPVVSILKWDELPKEFPVPYVAIKVVYKEGLDGVNLLILKKEDVEIIADLMMGGTGQIEFTDELTELQLSAIQEAMNQMVGSASTSLSSMLNLKIDINPPEAFVIDFAQNAEEMIPELKRADEIVKVAFRMTIGDLIDSQIMQLIPVDFAKQLVDAMLKNTLGTPAQSETSTQTQQETVKEEVLRQTSSQTTKSQKKASQPPYTPPPQRKEQPQQVYNVSPVQFESFDEEEERRYPENIELILDVPLEITVELGRTQKLVREILEFSTGSIIELEKLAGEPVDILVNGKVIAKGEVVVIDENFGVRITDIVNPSNRL